MVRSRRKVKIRRVRRREDAQGGRRRTRRNELGIFPLLY